MSGTEQDKIHNVSHLVKTNQACKAAENMTYNKEENEWKLTQKWHRWQESVDKHIRTVNITVFCLFKEPVERWNEKCQGVINSISDTAEEKGSGGR